MNLPTVIGIIALVTTLAASIAAWVLYRRAKHRKRVAADQAKENAQTAARRKTVLAWVEAIENAPTDEAIMRIQSNPPYSLTYYDNNLGLSKDEKERRQAAIDMRRAAESRKFYKRFAKASIYEKPDFYLKKVFDEYVNIEIGLGMPRDKVGQAFRDTLVELMDMFRAGDLNAMGIFRDAVQDAYRIERFCKQFKIPQPWFPDDWDDLVDEFIELPKPSDYAMANKLTVDQVRQMAAEAVRDRDPLRAKRVLALCRKETYVHGAGDYRGYGRSKQLVYVYQQALGDTMLYVLQMLVADPARLDRYMGVIGKEELR